MAEKKEVEKKNYSNIDEILNIVLDENGESDEDMGLDSNDDASGLLDSEWEYESESEITVSPAVPHDNDNVVPQQPRLSTQEQTFPAPPNLSIGNSVNSDVDDVAATQNNSSSADDNSDVEVHRSGTESDSSDSDSSDSDLSNDEPLAKYIRRGQTLQRGVRTRGGGRADNSRHGPGRDQQQQQQQQPGPAAMRGRHGGRPVRGGVRMRGGQIAGPQRPVAKRLPVASWQKLNNNEHVNLHEFNFSEVEGLNRRMRNGATYLDYLELYFTDEIWKLLVTETNRFAVQFFAGANESSYTKLWEPVTILEMKTFLGLVMLMGIIHKPKISMYWSTDNLYSTPIFANIMKRDRFYPILKFLHFNNNNDPAFDINDENRDRLHKLRPLIDILRLQTMSVFSPGKNLSVDESLVLFKGRLHFKQFIRTKRARFGVKLYELCTSDGITLDFLIYCGKGMFSDDDPHSDMPTTERIPAVLMKEFLGKGHVLFTDNFYTSPTLAKFLTDNDTHLCGTVRPNRYNFPKEINNVALEKGEACFYAQVNDPMIAVKYRANKDKAGGQQKVVCMLSTCHQPTMETVAQNVQKPSAVRAYNIHMGGVDRVDQQLHGFQTLRKAYKWYKKIAFRLLLQMTLNAHKVFQKHTGRDDVTLLTFMHDTVALLVASQPKISHNIRNVPDDSYYRLTGHHFPEIKKAADGSRNKRPTKPCRVCYARHIQTDKGKPLKTIYICKSCPSEPGLHIESCFKIYHTKLNYADRD